MIGNDLSDPYSNHLANSHLSLDSDFAALPHFARAPAPTIARFYFAKNEGCDDPTPVWVDPSLCRMLAALVKLEVKHGSSVLAVHLKASA
ncbi:hypothetical protein P3T25_009754 [Paraburkholderia sp. GAS32]